MISDPEQMRFYGQPKSRSEVEDWLSWNLGLYKEHGFGTWCVESRVDSRFIGYCGIRPLQIEDQPETELAWHLRKTEWNRGLGTEAARASMRLGLDRFGLSSLVAMIHSENHASRRVAEKLEMAADRELAHYGLPTVLYRTPEPG